MASSLGPIYLATAKEAMCSLFAFASFGLPATHTNTKLVN
jgi:hypothetical protein